MPRAIEVRRPGALRRSMPRTGLGADALSASVQAEVQGRLNSASVATKAQIASVTGVDVDNARVQQGAQSALSLLQHGYNPASDADSAQLVHAIAGGMALIPGGQIFAAYVELLWQVGQAVACPMQQAFASIGFGPPSPACGGAPCVHTGAPATAASVIASSALPHGWQSLGSFQSLVVGSLATYAARNLNCKGGVPPGMVVDAIVAIWNATHDGATSVAMFIPPLAIFGAGSSPVLIPFWGGGVSNASTGNVDPYVYYAFQPVLAIPAMYNVPSQEGVWNAPGMWPIAPTLFGSTPPRIVRIHSGALLPAPRHLITIHLGPPPATPAASSASSTGATVAKGAVVTIAGVAVAGSLYAFFKGQAIDYFWGKAFEKVWKEAKGLF